MDSLYGGLQLLTGILCPLCLSLDSLATSGNLAVSGRGRETNNRDAYLLYGSFVHTVLEPLGKEGALRLSPRTLIDRSGRGLYPYDHSIQSYALLLFGIR